VLAAVNSLIISVIGLRTGQLGLVPANLFCIVLYMVNLQTWRKIECSSAALLEDATVENILNEQPCLISSWREGSTPNAPTVEGDCEVR